MKICRTLALWKTDAQKAFPSTKVQLFVGTGEKHLEGVSKKKKIILLFSSQIFCCFHETFGMFSLKTFEGNTAHVSRSHALWPFAQQM